MGQTVHTTNMRLLVKPATRFHTSVDMAVTKAALLLIKG